MRNWEAKKSNKNEGGEMGLFLSIFLAYIIPSLIIASPIWFFNRERVHWFYWEFLNLLIPFIIWTILASANLRNKSLSNAGVESIILGILIGIIQIFPVIMPEVYDSRLKSAFVTLFLSIVITLLVYFIVPSLPE